jgi:hypothetical protein
MLRVVLILAIFSLAACAPSSAPQPKANPSPTSSAPREETPSSTGKIEADPDRKASLAQVVAGVEQALASHVKLDRLIYPAGYAKYQPQVIEVTSQFTLPAAETAAEVRVKFQDQFTQIHPTEAAAAADETLYPRRPRPTLEEMLSDGANPALKPTEAVLYYEVKDGRWHRVDWKGPHRTSKGADWWDKLGAP